MVIKIYKNKKERKMKDEDQATKGSAREFAMLSNEVTSPAF